MASRDRSLLYAAAFLRALATGLGGVLLGLWCAQLGLSPSQAGLVLGAGLCGATFACLLVTWRGDQLGRRRSLLLLALVSAAGAVAFALARQPLLMGAAALLGMLNGQGRDRGASLIVEQAALPATTDDRGRTRTFAVYNLLQDSGHALGSLLAGLPSLEQHGTSAGWNLSLGGFALLLALPVLFYLRLSPAIEPPPATARPPISPETRRRIARLSGLFLIDSLGGGFLLTSLLTYYFTERFGASAFAVSALVTGARVLNAASHLVAAWLARRIGLVNTMVFTHIPSSLLMLTVPIAPSIGVAAALYLLREAFVEMDVPTRQSYVMAIVAPHERTAAAGVTGLVRLAGWAIASIVAGQSMQFVGMGSALVIGAVLKIGYDLLLWRAFRHVRPPEEAA